jgi:hypothetical protein
MSVPKSLLHIFPALLLGTTLNPVSAADDPWARAPIILQGAGTWHTGDSIPTELRRFRKSPGDMPEPMDSEMLIAQINNLSLLAALATDISADSRCREDAFVQGTYAGGPTKFFGLVERDLNSIQGDSNPWLTEMRSRIAQPHIVVEALDIRDAELSREETKRVLDRIERDLRGGAQWQAVYERYADEFRDPTGPTTKIGNLGHFVVFRDPALGHGHFVDMGGHAITWEGEELPRRLWRLEYFDASHLPAILRSKTGEILRLHSADYHQSVLYQVQEVYSGAH